MKKFALRGMVILAAAVALCIFFSGTVRTLTTPKARFAQIRTGKMEQEVDLTGKVVFPEEEELTYSIPEGMTLTVTRVHVTAGSKVKAGDPLVSTRVTEAQIPAKTHSTMIAAMITPHSSQIVAKTTSESAANIFFIQPRVAPSPNSPPEAMHISDRVC